MEDNAVVDVTTETLTPTRVRLTITVPFADLEPSVNKAYKNVSQQMRVPGFRPGKVPRALVDQRGRSLRGAQTRPCRRR